MTSHYDHAEVQEFWQYVWERDDVFALPEDVEDPTYVLGMFPYTSGTLHMGHVRNYAITDAYARYRRMQGDDVLHPMGWDAFGLPAENAALERYSDPESWTRACIRQMREELQSMGFGYDWDREITTCDPEYYRWNQWLFARLHEAGLVEYEAATVNWCPDCETVLADAQVERLPRDGTDGPGDAADGPGDAAPVGEAPSTDAEATAASADPASGRRVCWRCETPVGRRELDQWFFTITDYAEELHEGLDDLDGWPEGVRGSQRNWIGRQEGATIEFEVAGHGQVSVFSTRAETIRGATYLALAPGHELVDELAAADEAVAAFVDASHDRAHHEHGFDGVETDLRAIHPLTGEELPVYVADYVLADVGTGAVMGVPGHNERDHRFAREHDLPIETVVVPDDGGGDAAEAPDEPPTTPYTSEGVVRGGEYDGLDSETARERLVAAVDAVEADVTYRLRDWLISRQRYWGTPIPIVHCEDCGPVLVPDEDLPVELPEFVHTTGNPLAERESFVRTECPDCGGPAERETDTMDTFVDSSWYFLRFLSPDLADAPFDPEVANETLPVDVYVGGEEHAILHLLYIRFFTRALADIGLLDVREPVERLLSQGTIRYEGEKMSSSKGNVVAPHEYGAETTRLFVLSAAHPEQDFEWTANDVGGAYDLQERLHAMVVDFVESAAGGEFRGTGSESAADSASAAASGSGDSASAAASGSGDEAADYEPRDAYVDREIDRTIAAVTGEFDRFRFHRAVTEIRELAGLVRRYREYEEPHGAVLERGLLTLAALIGPLAPHLAEELWNKLRGDGLVAEADWPEPRSDVADRRLERRLVERTLEDVRDIVDVAAIDDPETIELVVAPAWHHWARELVAAADDDLDRSTVVERVTADDALRGHGDEAAELVAELAGRRSELGPVLDPERELAELRRASWLLAEEFDASVTVRRAAGDDDLSSDARPGKPAIQID